MDSKKLYKLKEIIREEIKSVFENQPTVKPDVAEPTTKPAIKPKRRTLAPPKESPDTKPKAEALGDKDKMIQSIANRYKNLSK